jgi:DNA modification methylase
MKEICLVDKHNEILSKYFKDFSKNGMPIEVSFRSLVKDLNNSERYTHLIHSYPAKLLVHIPYFFLNNTILSKPGDLVLDPFCGTGTVLLESVLSGRNGIGADINPLARLISKVKVKPLDQMLLNNYKTQLNKGFDNELTSKPEVANCDYWFLPHVQTELANLISKINNIPDIIYRDFFKVCFSQCIKKVSLTDPRISVPVRLKIDKYPKDNEFNLKMNNHLEAIKDINVKAKFFEIVESNIKRIELFSKANVHCTAEIISSDARKLKYEFKQPNLSLSDSSVDLIITSPPYAGAQKYIRASSLNLGWLNLAQDKDLKQLDQSSIGRENFNKTDYTYLHPTGIPAADNLLEKIYHINPKRSHLAATYLNELSCALDESIRVLKPGGYFVIVIGNNHVCGNEFTTHSYLEWLLKAKGLCLQLKLIDDIKSRGLMTKRNKTASIITREWILIFKK